MALKMDESSFLEFYTNTMNGYSNAFRRYTLRIMEEKSFAVFDSQIKLSSDYTIPYVDRDNAIDETTNDIQFAKFYEYLEVIKLYKYSVPLFFSFDSDFQALFSKKGYSELKPHVFIPSFILGTMIGEESPVYYMENNDIYLKFVLQKSYVTTESEVVNYRFPVVIYINTTYSFLEIRYDAVRYDPRSSIDTYTRLVLDCMEWIHKELGIKLFSCNHNDMIPNLKDNSDDSVKIYKQMMQLSSGGSAELTASEQADYVLPFIGELRELIDENESIFDKCDDVRKLLEQYLDDKEATASYPYIYIKWVKPVESESYTVKVIFDYFNTKYTLMQHISGQCKNLGKERMNDAIKYLCESRSFVKGEEISL